MDSLFGDDAGRGDEGLEDVYVPATLTVRAKKTEPLDTEYIGS